MHNICFLSTPKVSKGCIVSVYSITCAGWLPSLFRRYCLLCAIPRQPKLMRASLRFLDSCLFVDVHFDYLDLSPQAGPHPTHLIFPLTHFPFSNARIGTQSRMPSSALIAVFTTLLLFHFQKLSLVPHSYCHRLHRNKVIKTPRSRLHSEGSTSSSIRPQELVGASPTLHRKPS